MPLTVEEVINRGGSDMEQLGFCHGGRSLPMARLVLQLCFFTVKASSESSDAANSTSHPQHSPYVKEGCI